MHDTTKSVPLTQALQFGPYTPITQAGELYFVSGQVGVNPDSRLAAADIESQTRQALANLNIVLSSVELKLSDVIKTTVFLINMSDFDLFNAVYCEYFDHPRPARSCIAVASLPKVAGDRILTVEIEAVAYKKAEAH